MIRKEAWSFYRTSSGVRLCWELEEPTGPKDAAKIVAGYGEKTQLRFLFLDFLDRAYLDVVMP